MQSENRSLKRQLQVRVLNEIVGQSEAANDLRESVRAAADQDGCVLFHGEAGAGNEQAARVAHLAGRRSLRPFLVIDCHVHSTESLERELLGNRRYRRSSPESRGGWPPVERAPVERCS